MERTGMSLRSSQRRVRLFLLAALVTTACLGEEPSPAVSVSVAGTREVAATQTREFILEIRGAGAPLRRAVFSGPQKLLSPDHPPATKVVGRRLLAFTEGVLAIFDLATGKEELFRVAIPPVTPTADGRRVAYIESQLPFTPKEATSMIVNVVDVSTLDSRPVFPERTAISKGGAGNLLVWEEDPAKRCTTDKLFWSPEGNRLLFFCASDTHEYSSVLVDLRKGLDASRFTRQPLPREQYLKPGAPSEGSETFFAVASVTWLDGNRVEVRTAPQNRWLKDRLVLDLPTAE
jgi:hypothetical protein